MFFEPGQPHGLRHNPLKALIGPRPIGWISTLSRRGVVNLAPYSFFNGVSAAPPMVMFAADGNHADGGRKDSVVNAEETGEFVCNIVTEDLAQQMNLTSEHLPRDFDELAAAGLTPAPSRVVKPPRVAESPAHLECAYHSTVELPSLKEGYRNCVVFGRIVGIHIADAFIKDGMVDTAAFGLLARLGYHDYTSVRQVFQMKRPDRSLAQVSEPEIAAKTARNP